MTSAWFFTQNIYLGRYTVGKKCTILVLRIFLKQKLNELPKTLGRSRPVRSSGTDALAQTTMQNVSLWTSEDHVSPQYMLVGIVYSVYG